MRKRMTDVDIWGKAWFQDLEPKHKLLWNYIKDNCDVAGIWDVNFRLASFQIGIEYTSKDLAVFGDKVLSLSDDKLMLVDFIDFQYGELSIKCHPHIAVIKRLQKAYEDYPAINSISYVKPYLTLTLPLAKGSRTLKDKDKDKEQDKDIKEVIGQGDEYPAAFIAFWADYPNKTGKIAALKSWQKATKTATIPDIMAGLAKAKTSDQWTKDGGKYIPHPATWLNQGRWMDEPTQAKQRSRMYD